MLDIEIHHMSKIFSVCNFMIIWLIIGIATSGRYRGMHKEVFGIGC